MTGLLTAEKLFLTFYTGGVEFHAVRDLSLSIDSGEFVGIMGPSGSGKSSLLYMLAGLKRPTSGTVRYKETDLTRLTASELADFRRKHFGFIFQQHFLIGYLTVLENVMVGCPTRGKAEVERAVELLTYMGLGQHLHKYPHELSGGQRQRVAAVRAMVPEPEVIFADEPTASLDRKTAHDLMAALTNYCRRGGTLVVVTHDPEILADAHRVVRVRDGQIVMDSLSA